MANEQNLIKNEDLTPEQRRANASKAGKASGEARKRKKLLKECLEELLEKEIAGKDGNTMTGAEAIAVRLFQKALTGDIKAFEVVRDTAGQKPAEKVIVSDIDNDVINEVERMVEGGQKTSN